jgi:4-hydroxyphenylacetate 3-monooxygenase
VTPSAPTGALTLTDAGTGDDITLDPQRLVIAGYTARDQAAVQAHIDELAHIGVAPPPRVPMFYEIPADLLTTEAAIVVDGAETSGEVEPVLISSGGGLYLGLGSDHTDRQVEKRDIAESKASAPKPLGSRVLPLERVAAVWDQVELTCRLDGEVYQQGRLEVMLPPDALLRKIAAAGRPVQPDCVMFCGTLPLLRGAFIYGTTYQLELRLPDGTSLTHTYDVKRRSS